jgi:hypothetical protein
MNEAPSNTGKAFAADLKKIREARGITLEDLHDETKIPRGLIESFEDSGLIDHPMFNRVYLRSFVRTYAEVVKVSPDTVLAALDESIEGRYRGKLAVEYLGAEPPAPPAPVAPAAQPPTETAVEVEEEIQPVHQAPPAAYVRPIEQQPMLETGRETYRAEPRRPVVDVAPARLPSRPPRPVAPLDDDGGSRRWIWVAAGAAVLVVLGILIVSRVWSPAPEQVTTAEPADTSLIAQTETPPPVQPVAIGDSMDVAIVAAGGPVQGIRVTVDDDLRRPYWIEEGQSRVFPAAQQIVIEEQLDAIQLQLEGRPYPTDNRDEQGRIVITRERAEQYLSQAR